MFCVKNRRFSIRFLTKPRMYTAADKTCVSIWKSTINQHFRFTVHSRSQFLSGSRLTGGPAISRFFTREGPTVFCSVSRRDSDPPPGAAPVRTPPRRSTPESQSILVLRGVILVPGLDAVVSVTEALPVALIPEENAVSSVRLDVIDIGRLDVASSLHALHTQRMCLKVTLAGFVPCRAVASAACRACLLRVEGTVLVTVLRTVGNERSTAGMPAWCIWSAGHRLCLLPVLIFGKERSAPQMVCWSV